MSQPGPISYANDHLLTKEQLAFCWNTLEYINNTPKECVIPLQQNNNLYLPTVDAIKYIIDTSMDIVCGFTLAFDKVPNPTLVRKYRSSKKWQSKSCPIEINDLSSRYTSPTGHSTITENENDMAKTTRKKTTTIPAETVAETLSEAVNDSVNIVSDSIALVEGKKVNTIESAFVDPRKLVQQAITKISAYKAVTSQEEAEGLKASMLNLHDTLKKVDAVHKAIKAPYFDACKKIDAAKREIVDDAEVHISNAKNMLHMWDMKQREAEAERQRLADLERKQAEQDAIAAAEAISNIKVALDQYEQATAKLIIESKTRQELFAISTQHWAPFIPSVEAHGPFLQYAQEMKQRLLDLGKAKDAWLQADEDVNAKPIPKISIHAAEEIKRVAMEKINAYAFQYNQAIITANTVQTQAQEEITVATEITKMGITGNQIAEQHKPMVNYRRTWRFEVVVDEHGRPMMEGVHPNFLKTVLDEEKVVNWMNKQNESPEPLQNGEIAFGLVFYVEEKPVMPRS